MFKPFAGLQVFDPIRNEAEAAEYRERFDARAARHHEAKQLTALDNPPRTRREQFAALYAQDAAEQERLIVDAPTSQGCVLIGRIVPTYAPYITVKQANGATVEYSPERGFYFSARSAA